MNKRGKSDIGRLGLIEFLNTSEERSVGLSPIIRFGASGDWIETEGSFLRTGS